MSVIHLRIYLDCFERINFLGEDGDERTNDGEEDEARSLRLKRSARALNIVPLSYNYQIHNVSDSVRSNSGMSTDQYKGSIYDRLALSLSCPLPNEHDFAFNMCTLLSNEGKHTLQLPQCPRLLDFMLSHTGVFRDRETQKYFISNYKEAKGKSLVQFWIDSIDDKSVLDLLSPDCYEPSGSVGSIIGSSVNRLSLGKERCGLPGELNHKLNSLCDLEGFSGDEREDSEYADSRNEDQRGKKINRFPQFCSSVKKSKDSMGGNLEQVLSCEIDLRLEPEDSEIFHLGRDLGLLDSEGTRISQVLHILRNLSFEEINIPTLAQSNTCLRFLVLCICSRWGGLAVGALDTLGNIAAEILMKDPAVYDQICRYLTIHDIMLLIYTLECLYSLSSMGSSSCNAIVRAKGSVQTLISLLTVEAQSYGPEACIGMKVVETVTGVVSEPENATVSAASQSSTTTTTTSTSQTGVTTSQTATVTSTSVGSNPKVLPKLSEPNKRVVPPEVEEFVTNWVTKNYIACPNFAIEQAIVYRHFAAAMHAMGRKTGLNPVLLSNCVRKVFGTSVGPSRRPVEDGTEKWHYNGIRRKEGVTVPAVADTKNSSGQNLNNSNIHLTPTPIVTASNIRKAAPNTTCSIESKAVVSQQPQLVVSPSQGSILKAQLSAPLRNSPSPVKIVQHQGVSGGVAISPNPSPSYSGTQSGQTGAHTIPRSDNSSLIKSLLANKVTTTMIPQYSTSPVHISGHNQSSPYQSTVFQKQQHQSPQPHLSVNNHTFIQPHQKAETSGTSNQPQTMLPSISRSFIQPSLTQGYNPSGMVVSKVGTTCGTFTSRHVTPGCVQVSRNMLKTESSSDTTESNKTVPFNGICNEFIKSEEEINSSESKKVLSFEGIFQNGIKDKEDEAPLFRDGQNEKKNILADLLKETLGGDVLNGMVEKDLRVTEKGIQVVSHMPYARVNGPSNGQMESTQVGIKRPATPDNQGSVKRLAIEDPRAGQDSRITLYVSQNGNDGEVLSQGHQVILNQGQQATSTGGQVGIASQTVMTPQGQMIIQRPSSQGSVIVQQSPQIISAGTANQIIAQRTPHHSQVITYTTQSQGQAITTCSTTPVIGSGQTQMIATQGGSVITSGSGQVIQQVIAHGQGGQKVILHGNQLSQVLGGQVLLPQAGGQNILVPQSGSLSGQVIMQSVSVPSSSQNPVLVQSTNGHNQVLVQSGGQGQVLLHGGSGQSQLVVSGVSQGQAVVNTGGQTMIFTTANGQQVMVGGNQGGQHVVMSGGSQGQGQMLVQGSTMVVSSNQPQSGPVVLPRQVVQVVSSSANTPQQTITPAPIRVVKSSVASHEPNSNVYSPNMVSVQVHTGGGVAPPPSGPIATPVTQSSGPISVSTPHIPAPQVLSSGVARRPKTSSGLYYVCEWRGCNQVFSTPGQVYHHACKIHCPPHIVELTCQWVGCDAMVRKRFSAMTHIHDRHCNEQLLQVLALRRQQIATSGKTDIPVPQTPPPHPGYAPNAAYHAIKRHALEVINQRDAVVNNSYEKECF
ncbi:AT-rich interactive domain-containing protein 2, partial [Armadillidium nasatum]